MRSLSRRARVLLGASIVLVLLIAGQVAFQVTHASTVHITEADNGRVVFVPLGAKVEVYFADAENLGDLDALYSIGVLKCPTVEAASMTCSVVAPGPAVIATQYHEMLNQFGPLNVFVIVV